MRLLLISCVVFFSAQFAVAGEKAFVDVSDPAVVSHLAPTSAQVTVTADHGIAVNIAPGKESYPGLAIKPAGGKPWDLSAWGDVRAKVVNTGKTPVSITLRVDNAGPWQESPFNAESISLKPGEAGEIKVIFGFGYGLKPMFALKPGAVVQVLLFAGKSKDEQSFRIEAITADGAPGEKPPVDPESVQVEPVAGNIVGNGVAGDGLISRIASGTGKSLAAGSAELAFEFPVQKSSATIEIAAKAGRWDLRSGLEARIVIKNTGAGAIAPMARLDSNGGSTDTASAAPILPGTEGEIVIPFIPAVVWQGIPASGNHASWDGQKNTGTKFTSDAVSHVSITLPSASQAQSIVVHSVRIDAPPAVLPDWLGQHPPVPGEWTKTFDDEFDGKAIDATKWNTVGKNWYDRSSRFVSENVIVADGVARLHFEKRPGNWANPADGKETQYATGFLDTYGKWTQRYGYFESRMKLPRSPGLWPAFWMMPDRGAAFHGDRGSTGDGGMEFDIMEHLTRWGPYRYNIAMHWDGYGKDHKATGTSTVYVQPDKDGFITAGLLWTPGLAVYYCNGKEVLRWENPRISSVPADMMFTLPMGGWDNNALDDAKLPDDLIIDYVRCWQREDLKGAAEIR